MFCCDVPRSFRGPATVRVDQKSKRATRSMVLGSVGVAGTFSSALAVSLAGDGANTRHTRCEPLTPSSAFQFQVTKSSYTGDEDFSVADQVAEELGEDGEASGAVTLATLAAIVKERASVAS